MSGSKTEVIFNKVVTDLNSLIGENNYICLPTMNQEIIWTMDWNKKSDYIQDISESNCVGLNSDALRPLGLEFG
jgi:hypothetical protein